jgi:hypothetical protein
LHVSIGADGSATQEPITVRPATQHRHSGSIAGSLPKSRPHSSSISSSMNPAHRVTRRKSMSSTAASNIAAMAAAAKGTIGAPLEGGSNGRRLSKPASQFRGPSVSLHPDMASSMPGHGSPFAPGSYNPAVHSEAITDGPALASMPEHEKGNSKARNRRASEGSRLSKGEGKRASGSDLRCEKCGKGYKHSSCLTKHLSVPLSLPQSSHTLSHLAPNALSSLAPCLTTCLRHHFAYSPVLR